MMMTRMVMRRGRKRKRRMKRNAELLFRGVSE